MTETENINYLDICTLLDYMENGQIDLFCDTWNGPISQLTSSLGESAEALCNIDLSYLKQCF